MSRTSRRDVPEANIPSYTIDLSAPPRERYKSLAREYKDRFQDLTPLFDNLLADLGIDENYHRYINIVAGMMLRGVHSRTETAELRGIADVSGMSMYLLAAFNVVLDLLMGCTSGAVKSLEFGEASHQARMLHFRTLDWGMDPLREIVVHLNFVRSKSTAPTAIVASSVTYVGYVGVLTGVRPGLSMSLNFRPLHNAATRAEQFRFYFHHLLVLLGLRPSISSIMRSYLYSDSVNDQTKDLATISIELGPRHTTACYLIFSNGDSTITMEKDYQTAVTRQSSTFIVATNHDRDENLPKPNTTAPAGEHSKTVAKMAGVRDFFDESRERMECIENKWKSQVRRHHGAPQKSSTVTTEDGVSIPQTEVIRWVSAWPTTNESTHFGVVMDPKAGRVLWSHSYAEAAKEPVLRL